MPGKPVLKILHVSSECHPFSKSGGLADVCGALPIALEKLGCDVRVISPLYGSIPKSSLKNSKLSYPVPMGNFTSGTHIFEGKLPNSRVPVYFLEHHHYYNRDGMYDNALGSFDDNAERFAFLSRAALEFCRVTKWIPHVIHCHDWQTGLVPVFINTVEWMKELHGCGTLFSIHNLGYQGVFAPENMAVTGLGPEHYNPKELEHFSKLNFLKGAIVHSNKIATVSPTYAQEIQKSAHGFGLDGELKNRSKDVQGILNGIDTVEWDPSRDSLIQASYSADSMKGKAVCKMFLQTKTGLPVRREVPLFLVISRISPQKGLDVLAEIFNELFQRDIQIILLGTGDPGLEQFFQWGMYEYHKKFYAKLEFDQVLAHQAIAGCDFLLMPSRYEPCGLTQMYAMRYGTLPVVRGTGGLEDSVENYQEKNGAGTGFKFYDLNGPVLLHVIDWVCGIFNNKNKHIKKMQKSAMQKDFSWKKSAQAYKELYLKTFEARRGHGLAILTKKSQK